ncbi:MAG TPA: hypothetical protein VHJ37_09990 [Thermoleophilaceae bacterium]|nr:hypothetical protein [Thermoleophilaceae bacterium]
MAEARIPALLVLLPALALGACGGGNDEEDIEQTVRGFVEATKDQDAETLCGELVTQDFLEKTTGASGDKAQGECRRQLVAVQGLSVKLDRIRKTEIDGDRATVTAVLTTQGSPAPRVLFLEKQDGDWKLSGSRGD